jgi:hypothetical protein
MIALTNSLSVVTLQAGAPKSTDQGNLSDHWRARPVRISALSPGVCNARSGKLGLQDAVAAVRHTTTVTSSSGTCKFSLNRRGFQRPFATADKAHMSDFPASYFRKGKK